MVHLQTFDYRQFKIERNVIKTEHQFIQAKLTDLGLNEFPEGFYIKGRQYTVKFMTHNTEMAATKVYVAKTNDEGIQKIAGRCLVTLLK